MDFSSPETYVSATHFDSFYPSQTKPSTMGIKLIPFPVYGNTPGSSRLSGRAVPRCRVCSSFYNCYNTLNGDEYTCSICGCKNKLDDRLEQTDAEVSLPVYEVYANDAFKVRREFTPTDFYVVSLSLIQSNPSVIDDIIAAVKHRYIPKQFGLCIYHGAVSVIKFRETTSILTISDADAFVKNGQLFVESRHFADELKRIRQAITELRYVPGDVDLISYISKIGSAFGSNIKLLMTCRDIQHLQSGLHREVSCNLLRSLSSMSIYLDTKPVEALPIAEIPFITGGMFVWGRENIGEFMKSDSYNDCTIVVRTPDTVGIMDYSGPGILKTHATLDVTKIRINQPFFFLFDTRGMSHSVFQFNIFFTTDVDVRKIRIITIDFSRYQVQSNTAIMQETINSFIAQRYFLDGRAEARHVLNKLIREFGAQFEAQPSSLIESESSVDSQKTSFMMRNGVFTQDSCNL